MNAPTTLTVITTNSNANSCGLSVGLGRFELPTFGPPDHRNLSETSVWTASARGFNDVCLTGTPVSVWWCAFCATKCATPKPADRRRLSTTEIRRP